MMCGVFAVGASAFSFEEFKSVKSSAFGFAELSAPVSAQGGGEGSFADIVEAIRREAENSAGEKFLSSPAYVVSMTFWQCEALYKNGKTGRGFVIAFEAAYKATQEHKDLVAFLDNDTELRAMYDRGLLKDRLVVLYNAFADRMISIGEVLEKEYFTPTALAFIKEWRDLSLLGFKAEQANLTPVKRAEINAKINRIESDHLDNLFQKMNDGDFAEATRLVKNAIKELEKVLVEYGIITINNPDPDPKPEPKPDPEPTASFFAQIWNFILRWFFFGWIWMK